MLVFDQDQTGAHHGLARLTPGTNIVLCSEDAGPCLSASVVWLLSASQGGPLLPLDQQFQVCTYVPSPDHGEPAAWSALHPNLTPSSRAQSQTCV